MTLGVGLEESLRLLRICWAMVRGSVACCRAFFRDRRIVLTFAEKIVSSNNIANHHIRGLAKEKRRTSSLRLVSDTRSFNVQRRTVEHLLSSNR